VSACDCGLPAGSGHMDTCSSIEEPDWVTSPDCPAYRGKGWVFYPDDCEATDYLPNQKQCLWCLEERP